MAKKICSIDNIAPSDIKPNNYIKVFKDKTAFDWVKVKTKKSCKNGKHGAAKIMIEGTNLKTGNASNPTFNGNAVIEKAMPVKITYLLQYYDNGSETLHCTEHASNDFSEIDLKDVTKSSRDEFLLNYSKLTDDSKALQLVAMDLPGITILSDFRQVDGN